MSSRIFVLICFFQFIIKTGYGQAGNCTFKPPFYQMHFGKGNVQEASTASPSLYSRVSSSCPTDGHYTYTSYTSDCFRGDWHTLDEDHTPGDVDGNMLLVNSAYSEGVFFVTRANGFKGGTRYQFGVWLMNVCRPTRKCPFPLLPNLLIRLQTPNGKTVAQFSTGELPRVEKPYWTQHKALFVMPPSQTELILTFINTAPGGCGNDLAMDDISFRECVIPEPAKVVEAKKVPKAETKKEVPVVKKEEKKPKPVTPAPRIITTASSKKEVPAIEKPQPVNMVPVPMVLRQRTNALAKHIETGAGELTFELYDNGEIDGDTVSIYHNNVLIVARQVLSRNPIAFRIQVDKKQPHHELVMVADNLGAIPPNTSVMMVTTKEKRHQVFISSTVQQNAKVVIDLRE